MFSQKQLDGFGEALSRRRISQKTFDEAVQENIEEFDMELEEAIESAIEEFISQGVDLTGIYTGTGLQSHAIFTLSSQLRAHIESGDVASMGLSLKSLRQEVEREKQEVTTAVILASSTMASFEPGVKVLQESSSTDSATKTATFEEFLNVYAELLLLSNTLREAFRDISEVDNVSAIPFEHDEMQVQCAALMVAGSLAVQDEVGKSVIMSLDPQDHIVRVLEASRSALLEDGEQFRLGINSATALIVPLTSADDTSQPSSGAFANARKLAQSGVSLALIDTLRVMWTDEMKKNRINFKDHDFAALTCKLCTGLKLLAANDEICKQMAIEMSLLDVLFVVINSSATALAETPSRPDLMASAMALLRQMMASDHVKHAIDTSEFIAIAISNLQMYVDETYSAAADPGNKVLEHTLGTVSALCLRNPEASEAIVDSGCAQLMLSAMQIVVDRKQDSNNGVHGGVSVGKCLRQGCMAVRNIASRSPHVREILRSYSAVEVIENCKGAAKGACADVGDAAIRDVTNAS